MLVVKFERLQGITGRLHYIKEKKIQKASHCEGIAIRYTEIHSAHIKDLEKKRTKEKVET